MALVDLSFSILGPVEVFGSGRRLDLGQHKQRLVLASLLVAAPEVVSIDGLIDRVWGEHPPASAAHALQVYVSNLRKLLEPDRRSRISGEVLVTRDPGYQLAVPTGACDADRFEELLERASAAESTDDLTRALDEALGLWRGAALADVADHPWAVHEASRLNGLRLAAMEDRFEAHLAAGRHRAVVHDLEATARRYPLRERLWAQLILALYRCGRQADALRAHGEVRSHLVENLGIGPGPELSALETAVLRHDPSLDWSAPAGATRTRAVAVDRPREDPGPVDAPPDQAEPRAHPEAARSGAPQLGATEVRPTEVPAAEVQPNGAPSDGAAADERRIVTALFADLVGSTPLGEVLPADEFKLVVDGAMHRMVAACEDFGGRVVNVAGDGMLALFGAPIAHEDDAERAVLAGLRLVAQIVDYGADVASGWGVEPLASRVGINTGPVVAGLTGAGGYTQYSALGDTVNTAARLESAARPDTVLVGVGTREQLGPAFSWSEPRTVSVKGKERPVVAFEAVAGQPGGGRPRGIADRPTPMMGRDAELGAALEAVDEVLSGRGGILLVTGAAGLGKSRLLTEIHDAFADRSDPQRPGLWLQGSCPSYGASRPLWPIREILTSWIGGPADQPELRLRVALRSRLDNLFEDSAEPLTALSAVLGIEDPGRGTPAPDSVEPGSALHDEVCAVLARVARDRPVIVAVDDLHWADAESIRLLERLAEGVERSAILLVLVSRPEPGHGSWRLREHVLRDQSHRSRHVELDLLDHDGSASVLEELVGPDVLPPEVRDELLALSGGNPFYLEELVRTLLADEVLVRVLSGFQYAGGRRVRLPDSVGQVLVSRLDRVSSDARSVLTAASVLGRSFTAGMLTGLLGETMGEVELEEALLELQRHELVCEVRRWPDASYEFEHALIREATYDTLVVNRRRQLHGRAAEVLAGHVAADDADAGEIAHHWELAGEDDRAFEAYHAAAAEADARGIMTSATSLYTSALDAAARLGTDHVGPEDLAPLLVARGVAALRGGDLEGSPEGLETAVVQARVTGDRVTEALALKTLANSGIAVDIGRTRHDTFLEALTAARAAADPAIIVRVLAPLAIDEANDLALDTARDRTLEAMTVVQGASPAVRSYALDARKLVALYLGELAEMRGVLAELEPILEQPDLAWMRRYVVLEVALLEHAVGDSAEAEAHATEALALSDRVSGSADREAFLAVLCRVRRARGTYGSALEVGCEAVALAQESGRWWVPWAAAEHGSLLIDLGRFADAVGTLRSGLGSEPPMRSQEVRCAGLLALAGHRAGDEDAESTGIEAVERMLAEMTCPPGMTYLYGADAALSLAEVRSARAEHDRASSLAESVARAAEVVGWLEPAAWSRYVLGLDASRRGDDASAITELHRCLNTAGGGLPGLAWRAHAALGVVGDDDESTTRARSIVEELARTLDEPERAGFLERFSSPSSAIGLGH